MSIKCAICDREFTSYKGLSSHIRQTHKITSEDYYVKYIDSSEHLCKTCEKIPTKFVGLPTGFGNFCSRKCAASNEEIIQKRVNTFKANEANVTNARNRRIKYNKSAKARQRSHNVGKATGSKNIKKAHEQYDGLKYCETCGKETKHIIGIGCMTCYNRSETHKQNIVNTIKEKYGSDYTNVWQVPNVKEQIVKTSLERYNTVNPGNSREARIKAANTMHKNDNYSSWEDKLEKILIEHNITYEKQYSDERYPFPCDFYLPDNDTFVELNGYWSHGNHYFNSKNPDDIEILNHWKEKAAKGHRQYANAIKVWSVKDLLKKSYAENNHLNYVVLWTLDDIDNFAKTL